MLSQSARRGQRYSWQRFGGLPALHCVNLPQIGVI